MVQLLWRDVRIGDGAPISTSLTADETTALRELAEDAYVLEIGSAYGYSTIVMAQVAAHVWAIDPHEGYGSLPNSLEGMTANLAAYGVTDKVTISRTTSDHERERQVDMVFIDGDHRQEAVECDIALALASLATFGGMLACHDFQEDSCPGVTAALTKLFPDGPDELTDTLWIHRV